MSSGRMCSMQVQGDACQGIEGSYSECLITEVTGSVELRWGDFADEDDYEIVPWDSAECEPPMDPKMRRNIHVRMKQK